MMIPLLLGTFPVWGKDVVVLKLAGTPEASGYTSALLTHLLGKYGYASRTVYAGNIPTTRLEIMMEDGDLSAFILGETASRNRKLVPLRYPMTGGLMGKRILFIPAGTQGDFEGVKDLQSFRALGKIAGMGASWGDVAIWQANSLPVYLQQGDWKLLFRMLAEKRPGIDYLPRGAQEILLEVQDNPRLEVEANLVLQYEKDHILYVSPKDRRLVRILSEVLPRAFQEKIIEGFAREYYKDVYHPPVNLQRRRIIPLVLP